MPAPRLFDTAMKRCIQSHHRIESVGSLPFSMVKPILIRIDTAAQLHEIEQNSPQVIGEDADLWRNLIKRDVPKAIRDSYDYEPEDPTEWHKVYLLLKKKADKKAAEAQAAFKGKMNAVVQAKKENVVREFKGIHRDKPKRGWGSKASSAPKSKADTGKVLLSKFRGELRSKPAPKMIINPRRTVDDPSVVRKAPAGMLQDYTAAKKAARPQEPSEISKLQAKTTRGLATTKTKLDTTGQQKLSDADLAQIPSKEALASRKRPAPSNNSSKPVSNIFMAPKRRKVG